MKTKSSRKLAIQRVGLAVFIIAGLTLAANLVIFSRTHAWQLLGIAGLIAMGGCSYFVARNMARKGRLDGASYLMLGALLVLLPAFALFSTGLTSVLAFGTLLLALSLASLVIPRQQMLWAVLVGFLGVGLTFIFDYVVPWPRFEMAQFSLLQVATYVGIVGPVLFILWQLISAYRQANTIRIRLLVAFVLVALLPMVSLSVGAVMGGVRSDRRQTLDRLETVADLKEVEVKNWVRNAQITLANVLNSEDSRQYMSWLALEDTNDVFRKEGHRKLQDRFRLSISQGQWFEELFLMNSEGEVVVSSNSLREAADYSQQAFFREGLNNTQVRAPSYNLSPGKVSIMFTRPLFDEQGNKFVLVGLANLVQLENIARKRAGLGETGETYLVGGDYGLVTASRLFGVGLNLYTQATEMAIEGHYYGNGSYDNYQGQTVLGVYRWLPELQVALVVEQNQREAFRGTFAMLWNIAGIALASVLVATAASLFFARNIAGPVTNLAEIARQIAEGDLELRAKVEREDEIGTLARAFNSMTGQLRGLISGLERRVTERTQDLERRAIYVQAAAEVGHAATSIRDLDELLPRVTRLISERFGFYHVGIFLLDDAGEYAVLRAASSEGGQEMLARGHSLRVGEQGIVGFTTATGKPRIALDIGEDAVHFQNPYLPNTRSEMSLPLVAGDRVLGALDAQSKGEAAFSREDMAVLQVLADQVAVAIENARLFTETQKALDAARRAYAATSRQAWVEILRARPDLGFRSDEHGVTIASDVWRPEMEQALYEGQTVQTSNLEPADQAANGGCPLAVPIKVRGQIVGVLNTYKPDDAGKWTQEEVATLEEITEQLGAALESARLYQDTQRRAARERLTREITDELRRAASAEGIVQTAVDELFKVMGTSHAFGQLEVAPPAKDRGQTSQGQ